MLLQSGDGCILLEDGGAATREESGFLNHPEGETHPPAKNTYYGLNVNENQPLLCLSILTDIHLTLFNIQVFSRYSLNELIFCSLIF